MYKKLVELKENSFSKYSNYKVSCIIEMKDGNTFSGVNVENLSFKDGLCAEQVAIGKAVCCGYRKGDFKTIYLLGSSKHSITPCFLCRQLILEFFMSDDLIITYEDETNFNTYKVSDLCPSTFTKEDLND